MIQENVTASRSVRTTLILLICIFMIALGVRLFFAWPWISGRQTFYLGDDDDYYREAISFEHTGQLVDRGWYAYRMPLFPIALGTAYWIFGDAPRNGYPLVVLCGALISIATYYLGKLVFDDKVGILSALWVAFDFDLIFYSTLLFTEMLYILLVVFSLIALERLRQTQSWQWAVICGCLMGLANLTRVNLGLILPFLLIWLVWVGSHQWKIAVRNALIVGAIVGVLWLTWIGRNFLVLNAFVPLTTQGGDAYYPVFNDLAADPALGANAGYWTDMPIPADVQRLHEVQQDNRLKAIAFEWISAHPFDAARIAVLQVYHFWRPDFTQNRMYVPMALLGLLGIALAILKRKQAVTAWAILICVASLTTTFTLGNPRFRLALYPVLAVSAAYVVMTFARWLVKRVNKLNQSQPEILT
jgi:4-amino-4-deoxy-L-arabinose transferase-like glycosyltransferase